MKAIKKVIYILLFVIIILPIVIHLFMLIPNNYIGTEISQESWLSFWGSYIGGAIGGIGTLLAVFFTIQYYDKQSKDSINRLVNANIISKVDIIIDKVYSREPISDSLYKQCYLNNDLIKLIKEYNLYQCNLIGHFTDTALFIFIHLLYITDEYGNLLTNDLHNYFKIPAEVREFSYAVGRYCLYENCSELIKGDSRFAHMIEKEAGGSWGLWYCNMHMFRNEAPEGFYEFFELVPKLLEELNNERNNLLES